MINLPQGMKETYVPGNTRQGVQEESINNELKLVPIDKSPRPNVDKKWNDVVLIVSKWKPEERTYKKFLHDKRIGDLLGNPPPDIRTIREQLGKRNIQLGK